MPDSAVSTECRHSSRSQAAVIQVVDPSTEEVVDSIVASDASDVHHAVSQARIALPAWSAMSVRRRAAVLSAIADRLQARDSRVIQTLEREVGTSHLAAASTEVGRAGDLLQHLVKTSNRSGAQNDDGMRRVLQEPAGVVAVIAPCQEPLQQLAATVGPALVAGCTVVLKPSTLTPLTAMAFAWLCEEAGLPRGVLHTVLGHGTVVGELLVSHPDIDLVAFTGSPATGRRVAATAARAGKGLVLRDGGDAATVLLDGAHAEASVSRVVRGFVERWGRGRFASGRLVVPRALLPSVESRVLELFRELKATTAPAGLPPLATRGQLVASLELVESAVRHGARVVLGGPEAEVPEHGYFLPVTLLSDVEAAMDVARYEINGPILMILAHDGPPHAVSIANGTPHAVFHEVWSADEGAALSVARGLDVRAVRINGAPAPAGDVSWHPDRPVEPDKFRRRKTVVIATRRSHP